MLTGGNMELIRGGTLHADTELLHHLLCHFDIRHPVGTLYLNRKIFRRQSRSNQQRTQKLTAVPDINGDMILSESMSGQRKRKMSLFSFTADLTSQFCQRGQKRIHGTLLHLLRSIHVKNPFRDT